MLWALFDPLYLIILAPGLALSLYATFRTKSTFSKYSQVGSRKGLTGAQAADLMLKRHGVSGIRIERSSGWLSDHYDPGEKALRLSDDVYSSQSLSAIGVACHEAGHAMQDAHGYAMLNLRTALVPATNFSSMAYHGYSKLEVSQRCWWVSNILIVYRSSLKNDLNFVKIFCIIS